MAFLGSEDDPACRFRLPRQTAQLARTSVVYHQPGHVCTLEDQPNGPEVCFPTSK